MVSTSNWMIAIPLLLILYLSYSVPTKWNAFTVPTWVLTLISFVILIFFYPAPW